jgi:UDP-N-acetylglucosamine:LPS N-acetylglucosamine transferase
MKPTIGIITSRGGHLYQMYTLKPWWRKYNRFWVTFLGEDSTSLLSGERVYYGYYPETRNIVNAFRNAILAWKVLHEERPTLLISCGAGIAPPFFYIAKLLGIKTVYIEPYDLIRQPSLTGQMLAPVVDTMLIQHESLRKYYPHALFKGTTL